MLLYCCRGVAELLPECCTQRGNILKNVNTHINIWYKILRVKGKGEQKKVNSKT